MTKVVYAQIYFELRVILVIQQYQLQHQFQGEQRKTTQSYAVNTSNGIYTSAPTRSVSAKKQLYVNRLPVLSFLISSSKPSLFTIYPKLQIFCPLYAQKCHVPLPDKPVLPTRAPPYGISRSVSSTVDRLCAQYRSFAVTYCNEPSILAQPRYRDACDKYNRFCIRGR